MKRKICPGKVKTRNATYKRRFVNLVGVERKVVAPAKVTPGVNHDLTEEISECLMLLIETGLAEFQNFFLDGVERRPKNWQLSTSFQPGLLKRK